MPTAHAAAHLHPSQRACGQNYTTANSLHLSIPPANITHFLPSCFFGFHPSFLLPVSPFPLPPPQITAVFTRALGDLPTRPRKRSHLPYQVLKKKEKRTDKKKKPHPNPTGQVACSCTGRLVWTLLCLCVGASCVSKSRQTTAILLLAPNSLIHSFVQSIASPPLSHFISLPWCGVSPSFLQDYTVENFLLLLLLPWPAFFSPGKNTDMHRPTLYSMPLQRANSFLLSLYFSLVGH